METESNLHEMYIGLWKIYKVKNKSRWFVIVSYELIWMFKPEYSQVFPVVNSTVKDSQEPVHSGLATIFINLVPLAHLITTLLHSGFGCNIANRTHCLNKNYFVFKRFNFNSFKAEAQRRGARRPKRIVRRKRGDRREIFVENIFARILPFSTKTSLRSLRFGLWSEIAVINDPLRHKDFKFQFQNIADLWSILFKYQIQEDV